MSEIDIVMPIRDAMPYLPAAVESLQAQTSSSWRLLIVDDGSVDGGPEWCESLDDDRICVITANGRGISDALNTGIAAATAPLIGRMDGDDISAPTRLHRQLERMAEGDLVALGTSYVVIDEEDARIAVQRVPSGPVALRDALRWTNPFCHGSLVFQAEAIRHVGGYREDFPLAEDYDLMLRLVAIGDTDNLDAPLYSWRLSLASTSVRRPRRQATQAVRARRDARRRGLLPAPPLRNRLTDIAAPLVEHVEAFRRASPGTVGHRWRAGLHLGAGNYQAALREYDALLKGDPLDLAARFRRRRVRRVSR